MNWENFSILFITILNTSYMSLVNIDSDKESPLLVMLHGCGQDPDDFAAGTNMNTLAEKEKFLVLYPDMNHLLNPTDLAGYNPFGCWNWFLDKNQHRGKRTS